MREKLNNIAEWALCAGIVGFTLIIMGMTALSFAGADTRIPTEVPPCPEEYQGGLKP